MRRRLQLIASALLIVAGPVGCDNVVWGGVDLQVVPPPPPLSAVEAEPDSTTSSEFGLPTGPLVFHIVVSEGGSQLIPIAEISGDTLRQLRKPEAIAQDAYESRFRQTVIPIGSQFEVFSRGARVGTFVAQSNGLSTSCGVPTAMGNTTVVAAAADGKDFVAFRSGLAPEARGEYTPPQITGPIRTYAAIVAERLILQAGLPRPRSWAGAQRDLQAIEVLPGGHPEMATTFLVGDEMATGTPQPEGYSVFYVADYETRRGYMPVYSEVRDYRTMSKAVPRVIDYLDWDGVAGPEMLIQVFGRSDSWYDVVSLRNGAFEKIYQGSACR